MLHRAPDHVYYYVQIKIIHIVDGFAVNALRSYNNYKNKVIKNIVSFVETPVGKNKSCLNVRLH